MVHPKIKNYNNICNLLFSIGGFPLPQKWRKSILWTFPVILFGALLTGGITFPSASGLTTVSVNPPTIADLTMGPGNTFSINVTVTDVENLWGYHVVVFYNTTVLNATGFESYPPFIDESPSSINRTAGYVSVVYSMEMGVLEGVSTNASVPSINLVRIDFEVTAWGVSLLDLRHVILVEPDATTIVNQKIGSSFTNIEVHNVVITDVTASPTRVEAPGDIFSFNINLSNQGDFHETFNLSLSIDELLTINQTDIFLARGDNTTRSFTWDTTGFAVGEYNVTVKAILPIDNYPADNTYTTKVRISVKRDVAVTNVTVSTPTASVGEPIIIYVVVKNLGDFPESFSVAAKYDGTVVGTKEQPSLMPGFSSTLAYNWETEGLEVGEYITSGEAVIAIDDDRSNNIMQGDKVSFQASVGSEVFVYAVVVIVTVVAVAIIARYALKIRKPKST